jgi:flagellar basal body-associated protein FliL
MIWIIIGITILIFLIMAFLLGILFYHWFYSADNPEKAWVFIDIAGRYKHVKGRLIDKKAEGEAWEYEIAGRKNIVVIPNDIKFYPIKYWKRRRVIGVQNNNIVASPLGDKKPEKETGNISLIKDLTLSHIGSDMVKAMSSGKTNWMILIIIIAIVVIIAVGGGIFLYSKQSQNNLIPATPTISTTLPPSGEVVPK